MNLYTVALELRSNPTLLFMRKVWELQNKQITVGNKDKIIQIYEFKRGCYSAWQPNLFDLNANDYVLVTPPPYMVPKPKMVKSPPLVISGNW